MNAALEKQLNLLDYALAALWRRRLKNGGLLLVFTAVIFLLASFHLVTTALTGAAASVLHQAPEILIQRMSAGRQEAIPLAYADELSQLFGIKKVVPRIWGYYRIWGWGYYIDETFNTNYTVLGVDPAVMPMSEHLGRTLAAGEYPGPEAAADRAVVGSVAQRMFKLSPGGQFALHRPDRTLKLFTAAGMFHEEADLLTFDLIAVSLADARDLFQIPAGLVTDLCVYVHNPAEIGSLARKIAARLPDTRVLTRPQIEKTYQVIFGWRSGFASICLLASLAAFTILAWDKASGLSPEERREITILKIIGWEVADVLLVRCWEAMAVALLAFLIGCTLAYLHVLFFEAALFRPVLVGWSVIRPALALAPEVALSDLLLLFSLTVLPYLAATVIPIWRGAAVPAEAAMHG